MEYETFYFSWVVGAKNFMISIETSGWFLLASSGGNIANEFFGEWKKARLRSRIVAEMSDPVGVLRPGYP